jgi:hypothetical protein
MLPRLSSPAKIQDFLNTIPNRKHRSDPIVRSPVSALKSGEASCMEGALIAAACLLQSGRKALLLDLKVGKNDATDVDHVVALFQENGKWGAVSKTHHAVLRYREPVYASVRELAMSFFHEYFTHDGKKTMRSFSAPFDICKRFGTAWIQGTEDVFEIAIALDESPHTDILPSGFRLRKADAIEIAAGKLME